MAASDNTSKEREEARLAMEDEAHRQRRQTKEQEAVKLRRTARLAMEGEGHRRKRELEERQTQLEKLTAEQEAAAKKAAAEAETRAKIAAEQAEVERIAKTEAERHHGIAGVMSASETIAQIKNLPVRLAPLRTFKTDMAEAVKSGLSVARMALSEQGRKSGSPASAPPTKRTRWFLVLLLLLVIAGAGGFFAWQWQSSTPNLPPPPKIVSPIFVEENQEVPIDTLNGVAIAQAIHQVSRGLNLSNNRIIQLYFTQNQTVTTFPQFVTKASWRLPEPLMRNLSNDFLWAVYSQSDIPIPLLVFKNSFFERAWDGMFQWEPTLWEQVWPFLKLPNESEQPRSASGQFQDKIIRNKDARVLLDDNGNILLVYSFLDDQHLLITRNETTFIEVLKRFIAK